jgi:hypothetical protein
VELNRPPTAASSVGNFELSNARRASVGLSRLQVPSTFGRPAARTTARATSAGELRLVGAGFPLHTFAPAFGGPDPAVIPLFNRVRCVGVGNSVRLGVAPTRDQGTPLWSIDLDGPLLAPLAVVGQPLYLQTIYRDGASVNLSDAVRLVICP